MKKKEKYDNREEQVEDATAEVEAYHSGINASTQVRFFNINFHLDSFWVHFLRWKNTENTRKESFG